MKETTFSKNSNNILGVQEDQIQKMIPKGLRNTLTP